MLVFSKYLVRCGSFIHRITGCCILLFSISICSADQPQSGELQVKPKQVTFGPENYFFGYIGHCRTTAWSGDGRYILMLRTDLLDRMPGPDDAAEVVLLDAHQNFQAFAIDQTRAWNPQQGTMFYWNPQAPSTQFFFNDRDPETGKVFCVLFDIREGLPGRRLREYRFEETPVGNSGASQNGGSFLAINYARMARLRPVTGYKGAWDWTESQKHPADDGIFKVDVESGESQLLVSFAQLRDELLDSHPDVLEKELFINHTLWSRDDQYIYFYVRGDFDTDRRLNVPFTMKSDGSQLTPLAVFIGGHPEWMDGTRLIGSADDKQVVYDVNTRKLVQTIGDAEIFPNPGGDIALSPDGQWLANGYRSKEGNRYVFYRMKDGLTLQAGPFDQMQYARGDLRVDPSPVWNRDSTSILIPSIVTDSSRLSRQNFLLELPIR